MKSLLNLFIRKLFGKKTLEISENYVPYVEEDTECDNCPNKNDCIKKGYLVNSTFGQDTREHYIKGLGCVCVKGCEEFLEMKLSEILEIADTDDMKKFIRKAIDQLGDMTYREFYQQQRFLEMFK